MTARKKGYYDIVEYLEYAATPLYQLDLRWNRRKAYVMVVSQINTVRNTRPTIEALQIHDIHQYIAKFL